jgi:hypothetical protein
LANLDPVPALPTARIRVLVIGLIAAAALLWVPIALRAAPAHAGPYQVSIMMDDDSLVYRDDRTRDRTMAKMKSLGVDYVRVTVLWSVVALGAKPGHGHFNPQVPSSYPVRNWDRYDGVVRSAQRLGLKVYLDVTGPGPSWSHETPPAADSRDAATWMPSSRAFYDFVRAVGTRYSGRYKARNHQVLPRVNVWALWNEPNQGGWLTPQWAYNPSLHRVAPASPAIYRNLFLYGRKALDDTGHGHDFVMAGETAPLGGGGHGDRSPIAPKTFIRELFCMDPSGHAYTGSSAAARGCGAFDKFGPLRASAWAHHPYGKYSAPNKRDPNPDAITMANINDLPTLLDQAAAATHHVAAGMPIMSTEFGYETNPPDPYITTTLAQQADYINEGDFLAWSNPRVLGNTQFLLTDAAPLRQYPKTSRRYWFTYQSGLLFQNGKPKPALAAYLLPFVAVGPVGTDASGHHLYGLWGQLRFRPHPLPSGTPRDYVQIQFQPSGSGTWTPLGAPIGVTNSQGFFGGGVAVPGHGSLRAVYFGAGGHISRAVAVAG